MHEVCTCVEWRKRIKEGRGKAMKEDKKEKGEGARWEWDNTDPSCNLIIPKFCGIVGQEDQD